jgi:outer membrane receptor protein involved in Fe transport
MTYFSVRALSVLTTLSYIQFIFCISLLVEQAAFAQQYAIEQEYTEITIQGLPFQDSVQDVPQSASVIGAEQLKEQDGQSIDRVLESLQSTSFVGGTSRPRFFLIRGVGELEQYEGAPNPSVALIIDGVDVSGLGVPMPLFDISQVAVLRGPQGIRYGASALAGAISITSSNPSLSLSRGGGISLGNDDLFSSGAFVSSAVPGTDDTLFIRLTAYHLEQNGFRDNIFLERDDTNKRDENFARLKLQYDPSTKFSALLTGWVSDSNNGFDGFAIDNSFFTQSDRPGEDDLQSMATNFALDYSLDSGTVLNSSTSLLRAEQDYSFDGDWGNNPFWAPFDPYDFFSDSNRIRKMISQELRLSSEDSSYTHGKNSRWLIGSFLQDLREVTATDEFADNITYDDLSSSYRARTGAVFGQYELPVSEGWSVTAGVRAERRVAEYRDSRGSHFVPNYNMLGGSLAVTTDLNESMLGYVNVSRGFKGGGFNAGPSVPESRKLYDPEFLWNYEAGIKGHWLDNAAQLRIAAFFQQRKDQQLKFAVQDDPEDPLAFTYITESSGKGKSYGLEMEGSVHPLETIELFLNGSLIETQFQELPADASALDGRSFSHAPNWQYTTGTRVSFTSDCQAQLSLSGRDRFYFDDSHNQRSDPYYLLGASLSFDLSPLRIILWGRNLTDESYATRGFFFGNEPPDFKSTLYVQRGEPRTFGVTLRYELS